MTNVIAVPQHPVTIVSFYAPRYTQWAGVSYDDCLDILDASCKRLGLRHVCISDVERPRVETFVTPLPENLMQAFLVGQIAWLKHADGKPTMFTGADCIVTRDPTEIGFGYDMAITTRHYTSINTGAHWCYTAKCIEVFEHALALNPISWGEDQTCLLNGIRKTPDLRLRELPMRDYNGKPKSATEMLDRPPLVAHFKGDRNRKGLMPGWWSNFLKAHGETVKAAA
jgi:hypothetical protein